MQDIFRCVYIRIVCVTTTQTSKNIPTRPIPPLSMTTCRTPLTRICRKHGPENNTVVFTSPFYPAQPVTISPCTERSPHTSTQATFELSSFVHVLETLNHEKPQSRMTTENILRDLVHTLAQAPSEPALTFGTVSTTLDRLQNFPNVRPENPSNRCGRKCPHPRVKTQIHPLGLLRTRFDLESNLNGVLSDNVGFLPSPASGEAIEVPVKLDGEIQSNFVSNGGQDQPGVELFCVVRHIEASDGARDAHSLASMCRHHSFISPSFLGGKAHVDSLTGRDFAKPCRQPRLVFGEIDDGFEEFSFGGNVSFPEMLNEEVDDLAILSEDFAELGSLILRGEFEGEFARSLDLHDFKLLYHGFRLKSTRNYSGLPRF